MPLIDLNNLNKNQFTVSKQETDQKVASNAANYNWVNTQKAAQNTTQSTKWYKGDQPTWGESLARASKIYQTDQEKGKKLFSDLYTLRSDPNSRYYNQYATATNQSIKNLQSYGFNTSVLNDDWFNTNWAWIQNNLEYRSGTSNTPSAPTKKSTQNQRVAYELYQYYIAEDKTKQAEKEYQDAANEAIYWALRSDRNYSDDQIVSMVRKDFDKKYKTLSDMDKKTFAPTEFNRGIDFSDDVLYAAIWMARNGDYSTSIDQAMVNYYNGVGKSWQENQKIANMLNPDSEEYLPYATGTTNLDDAARHFGVLSFSPDWTKDNKSILTNGSDEDIKMFRKVQQGEENSQAGEKAVKALDVWINNTLSNYTDPAKAIKRFDDLLKKGKLTIRTENGREEVDLSILNKMDKSMGIGDEPGTIDLVPMTRGVNYKYANVVKTIQDLCARNASNPVGNGQKYIDYTSKGWYGVERPSVSSVIYQAQDDKLAGVADDYDMYATEAEMAYVNSSWSSSYNDVKNYAGETRAWADSDVENKRKMIASGSADARNAYVDGVMGNFQTVYDYEDQKATRDIIKQKLDKLTPIVDSFVHTGALDDNTTVLDVGGKKYNVKLSYDNTFGYQVDTVTDDKGNQLSWSQFEGAGIANDELDALIEKANRDQDIISGRIKDETLTPEQDEQRKEYNSLMQQLNDIDTYLERNKDAYQTSLTALTDAQTKANEQQYLMAQYDIDSSDFYVADSVMSYLVGFKDYEKTSWNAYNPSDAYRIAIAEGKDRKEVYEAAKKGNAQVQKDLEDALAVKQYITDNGMKVPDNYIKNLDRHIAKLERDIKDYEYFTLEQNKDFEEMAQKGRDMEYENRPMNFGLIGNFTNERRNWTKEQYFSDIDNYVFDEYDPYNDYGLRGIAGMLTSQLSEDEKDIYYYLIGKGEKAAAIDYIQSLTDMSYGVLHTRYTEDIQKRSEDAFFTKKFDFKTKEEADNWIANNADKEYEITNDEKGYHITSHEVGSDANFIGQNILSILAAPMSSIASLGYATYNVLTGKELNPDNVMLQFNNFRTATAENSAKEIAELYGEGSVQQMVYEMFKNRLDSLAQSVSFGSLGLAGGGLASFLNEISGASGMGVSAGMDAMMEAKRRGADETQMWWIGAITFACETATEAIEIGDVKGAFKQGLAKDSIKSFFKDWLTKAGLSEALGESLNDILENAADRFIMGDKSEHAQLVWKYRVEQNISEPEAEFLATMDELKGVARTALMSYLSPGMDIASYTAGRGKGYWNVISDRKKQDSSQSISDIIKGIREEKQVQKGLETIAERKNQEYLNEDTANGEGQFNLWAMTPESQRRAEAEAQVETQNLNRDSLLTDWEVVDSASQSDAATQTANIAATLDIDGTEESSDRANAAAANLARVIGNERVNGRTTNTPKSVVEWIKNIFFGASMDNIDSTDVKRGITYAAIGGEQSASYQTIQSEEFQKATPNMQAKMLANAGYIDANNEAVNKAANKAIFDNRVAEAQRDLIIAQEEADAKVDKLKKDYADRQADVYAAEMLNEDKEKALQAANDDIPNAKETFLNDPSSLNNHLLKEAFNRLTKADTEAKASSADLRKAREALSKAEADLKAAQEDAMTKRRQNAVDLVNQTDTRRQQEVTARAEAQAAAEKAAEQQKRIDEELLKKAKETENFTRLSAEDFVDQNFPNISEEDRRHAIGLAMMAQRAMSRNFDSVKARRQFSKGFAKRFNLNYKEVPGGEINGANARIDPSTRTLLINEKATQWDIMYAVLTHEITHLAEGSDTYTELADMALQIRYGDGVTWADTLAKIKAGDKTSKIVQDYLHTKKVYDESKATASNNHSAEQILQEIVADSVGYVISGDDAALQRLATKPNLARRVISAIKSFIRKAQGLEGETLTQAQKVVDKLQSILDSQNANGNQSSKYMLNGNEEGYLLSSDELTRVTESINNYRKGKGQNVVSIRNQGKMVAIDNTMVYTDKTGRIEHTIRLTPLSEANDSEWIMNSNDVQQDMLKMGRDGKGYELQREFLESRLPEERYRIDVRGLYGTDNRKTGIGETKTSGEIRQGNRSDLSLQRGERTERSLIDTIIKEDLLTSDDFVELLNKNSGLKSALTSEGLAIPETTDDNGDTLTGALDNETQVKCSLSSWTEAEINRVRQNLLKNGFTEQEADKWINDVNSIAAIIAADTDRLDFIPDRDQTFKKPNGDVYKWTLDASTLCAKRLLYQGTFNEIQKRLPNVPLLPGDLIELANMMKEMGYQTPCGICYVESRRRHLGEFTQEFLDNYKGDYIPTYAELTSTDGLANLKKEHRQAYDDYIEAMNGKGVASPKVVQLRTDYRGDVRNLRADSIAYLNSIGGLRIQSFSDFETPHLMDMMQAVIDMAAVKLKSQAYTKVPNFAWVFGDTGIKINLSLMGEGTGVDENGNLIFSSTEGMDFEEAMKLRDKYSQNVGTILVGMNDAHIIAAMGDDRIDFIIPFHKSGWSQNELDKMKSLANYDDYQDTQNEKWIVGQKEDGTYITKSIDKKTGNLDPYGDDGYWDYSHDGQWNAEKYIALCAEQKRLPKFSQFLVDNGDGTFSLPKGDDVRSTNIRKGYWKTLIDFKMYDNDGNGAEQTAVMPNINMPEAYRVLNEYEAPEGGNNALPSAEPVVDEFVNWYNETHNGPATAAFQNMTLGNTESEYVEPSAQQNAMAIVSETGETMQYRNSLTDQELDDWFEQYISGMSAEELDQLSQEMFGIPLNTPEKTETPEQVKEPELAENFREAYKAAVDSGDLRAARKIIDQLAKKAGYTVRGTHRTNADFTVFDRSKQSGKRGKSLGDGFYVAAGEGTEYDTEHYGKRRMMVYINPGNVFDIQKGGLSEEEARNVYAKYFAPFHKGSADDAYDDSNPYTYHVVKQLQNEYKLMDYIKEAAENAGVTTDVIFKELGYNSIKDGPQYCVFDNTQIKSADPVTFNDQNQMIEADERFNEEEQDYRYSLPSDYEYLSAVDHGDMEEAQRLVDQRAEETGYNVEGYHATDAYFNEFKIGDIGYHIGTLDQANDRVRQAGMRSTQSDRENHVMHLYAKLQNPLVIDDDFGDWHGKNVAEMLLETEQWQEGYDDNAEEINARLAEIARMPDGTYTDRALREFLQSLGYDGIDYENQFEDVNRDEFGWANDFDRSYIVFDASQLKSADPVTYDDNGDVIPLSERFNDQSNDIRYSLPSDDILQRQIQEYLMSNQTPVNNEAFAEGLEGRNPGMTQAEGPKQRGFGKGMLQNSDEIDQAVRDYIGSHNAYFPDTNADQVERAIQWVRSNKRSANSDGFEESFQAVTSDHFNYMSADGQARVAVVTAMAVARGDSFAEAALSDAFNREGTDLGRAFQARKIWMLMTPEGRKKSLDNMKDRVQKSLEAKGIQKNLTFSHWIYDMAEVATPGEVDQLRRIAASEIAEQIPANWKDRLRSMRMLAMLGNPRTHFRNIAGNALFVPIVGIKNKVGALLELNKPQGQKTKTLAIRLDDSIREYAKADAIRMKDILTGEAKYNESSLVAQETKAFKGLLQAVIDFNSNKLEAEDWHFLRNHYTRAFGGWMQANGYTADQLNKNSALLEQGRAYAVLEAQKATYRDFNEFAKRLNDFVRNPKTLEGKAGALIVEAIMPFKKTPANILRRGLEYSPIGLIKSFTYDLQCLHKYNEAIKNGFTTIPEDAITPNQWIDKVASGLTGTGIMMAGMLLSSLGIITCGTGDDDDPDRLKGEQKYSFKVLGTDYTYTIDWMAPVSIPLFVGAALMEEHEDMSWSDLANAVAGITEPVYNMTMLDGLSSIFKTSSYGDQTDPLTQVGLKVGTNYISSYYPSLFGAFNRAFVDDTRRKSYVPSDKSQGPAGTINYALESLKNKTPLSLTSIPYRDVWGEAETSGLVERIFENFISPGYIQKTKNDPILNEMSRLHDAHVAGSDSLVPSNPPKSYTYKGEKYIFSDKEYDQFYTTRAKTAHTMLTNLLNSNDYWNADDATKVEMMNSVWSYATKVGRSSVIPNYEFDEMTVDTIAYDGKVNSYKSDMLTSLDMNDFDGYQTMIQGLYDLDVEDSKIRDWIRNKYINLYKTAYRNNNTFEMSRIENILFNSGYDFDLDKWEADVDEKYGY